ncbi:hypothetical protein [Dongia rigui]|uniref:Uncharacterized protein n=1 Tax=Dongia rigui TaxID=940149 RepID=A0ABU5E0W7_9PROT|nr:hypothetical protein [Dongia rigui]MDY0873103.1 hypothetical protein [Dongia rigui]
MNKREFAFACADVVLVVIVLVWMLRDGPTKDAVIGVMTVLGAVLAFVSAAIWEKSARVPVETGLPTDSDGNVFMGHLNLNAKIMELDALMRAAKAANRLNSIAARFAGASAAVFFLIAVLSAL